MISNLPAWEFAPRSFRQVLKAYIEGRIESAERLELSERDSLRVLNLLENPPARNARLLAAAKSLISTSARPSELRGDLPSSSIVITLHEEDVLAPDPFPVLQCLLSRSTAEIAEEVEQIALCHAGIEPIDDLLVHIRNVFVRSAASRERGAGAIALVPASTLKLPERAALRIAPAKNASDGASPHAD